MPPADQKSKRVSRPGQNPVTFRGTATPEDTTPVGLTVYRADRDRKPQDGLNRVGADKQKEPAVLLTVHTGGQGDFKVVQTLLLNENHLLDGLLLLFPDKLVDQAAVQIAKLRMLLFNDERPEPQSEE